ncbi:MAG: ABC transporter ATP-binding protein [Acidimicrobiales bacterium]
MSELPGPDLPGLATAFAASGGTAPSAPAAITASNPTAAPVLRVRDLDASYGDRQVLFGVDLDVDQGEVLALLGTNGAGKSTLLRAISGLTPADRGVIEHRGRAITATSPAVRVGLGIVHVPGGRAVFPSLSVLDNLLAGCHPFAWDRARVHTRIDAVLELFPPLGRRLGQLAGTLSGGEQQMLAIGKGLLLEPDLLLIDELSLGLAPAAVAVLLDVIAHLEAAGTTMVIVEQSVNVALSIAPRAVWMEKGRVRFSGPAADLLARADLVRAVFLAPDRT